MQIEGAQWLAADRVEAYYRVRADALLRYSRRGMLGAIWDPAAERWLFDMERVSQLFPLRSNLETKSKDPWGALGEVVLGGPSPSRRRPLVRQARGDRDATQRELELPHPLKSCG